MRLLTIFAALLLSSPAMAQTTPFDRHPAQQPTLAEQIDIISGKIAGNVSDLRAGILSFSAQAETLRQQLAEATQQNTIKDMKIESLTNERDALKAKIVKLDGTSAPAAKEPAVVEPSKP